MSNGNIISPPVDPIPLPPPNSQIQIAIAALERIAQEASKAASSLRSPLGPVSGPPVGIAPASIALTNGAGQPSPVAPALDPSDDVLSNSPTASSLSALSDLIESRISSDSALQAGIQTLISGAIGAQVRSSNFVPLLMKSGAPGSTTGVSAGSSGGSSTPSTPSGGKVPSIPQSTFWWGLRWYLSEDAIKAITTGAGAVGVVEGVLIAALGALPPPGNIFVAALSAFIAGEILAIKAVDKGKGVYVNMSWFAPAIFVPTSA